jgi:hypothetical protein
MFSWFFLLCTLFFFPVCLLFACSFFCLLLSVHECPPAILFFVSSSRPPSLTAQGAFDATMPFIHERKQFGQPIADFQAMQVQYAEAATGKFYAHNRARERERERELKDIFVFNDIPKMHSLLLLLFCAFTKN